MDMDQKAVDLGEKLLEIRKRVYGEDNVYTVDAMKRLAIFYENAGDIQKSQELKDIISKIDVDALGEE